MRGDVTPFTVARPRTLARALTELAATERPTPLAGGTDLYVWLNEGRAPSTHYLDLSRLEALRGITYGASGLWLGALTTYTDLRRSPTIERRAPVLADMAASVGAIAIQNRGTLGGSLGNASPAADPAPLLLALDATVELARRAGRTIARRDVPIAEFFTAYRTTAARTDELVTAIRVPAAALRGTRYAYRKVGPRRAQAISKVVVAVGLRLAAKGGQVEEVRIGAGSVAPTTVRGRAAERLLLGERLGPETALAAAQALVARDIQPIDDLRSTASYRRVTAARVLVALLAELGDFAPPLEAL